MYNIQLLSIITTSLLLLGTASYVTAEDKYKEDPNLKSVVKEISKDLKDYVKDESKHKQTEDEKVEQVKEEYSTELDIEIEKVLASAEIDYNSGSEYDKDILKQLLIQEELKWQKIEEYDRKANLGKELRTQSFEFLPAAYASHNSCGTMPSVNQFKQVNVDINGQYGFEGGNQLYNVARTTLSDCSVKYTLSFLDEDHPNSWIDAAYDEIRLHTYGRIADVEVFYVQSSGIFFDDTWSDNEDFFVWVGPHGTTTKPFSSTVYVSNTWNHNFDVVDENPSMSKFTWLF